jgi:hypothetical protein
LDKDPSSKNDLEILLTNHQIDWDQIVVHSSRHLVLPAVYFNLKKKDLLHFLPNDLISYLHDIASLNRERNLQILNQVHQIKEFFNKSKINYVFLKGSAMVSMQAYDDIGERMIGDIDVLVDDKQIDEAFDILLQNGYSVLQDTPGHANLNPKHKPRLVSDNDRYIGAVEIHNRLFDNYYFEELIPSNILTNSVVSNNIRIPTTKHLLFHTVLNWQINDRGMMKNSINFRSLYDCSVLLKKDSNLSKNSQLQTKVFARYFSLYALFYPTFQIKRSTVTRIKKWFFIRRLKSPFFNRIWQKITRLRIVTLFLLGRSYYFITNKKYRKAIVSDRNSQASKLKKFVQK